MRVVVSGVGGMGIRQGGLQLLAMPLLTGPLAGPTEYVAASLPTLAGGQTEANAARGFVRIIQVLRNKPQDPARKSLTDPNVQARARQDQLRAAVKRWIDEIRAKTGRSNTSAEEGGSDGGPEAEVRPQWLADP